MTGKGATTARILAGAVVALGASLVLVPTAAAHTAFESSDPADGAVVTDPIDEIVITFTAEATEAGEGFVVLTPAGEVVEPPVVRSDDGRSFTLTFDPPLVGGEVGVRWMVRAGDAHPIDGSFRFTTTAPVPTATAVPTPTAEPTATPEPTVAPAATSAPEPTPSPSDAVVPTTIATAVPQPTPVEVRETEEAGAPVTMDDFLDGGSDFDVGRPFGWVGRPLSVVGALALLGLVAFQVLTLGEPAGSSDLLRSSVPAAGAILLTGAVIEGGGLAIGDVGLGSSATTAVALRAIGALATIVVITAARESLSSSARVRFLGLAAVAVLASWTFDGHTVTEGPRALTAAVAVVHVAAASVWAGGVLGLFIVARRRRERLVETAIRFSVVASVAVVVVGAAGLVLTVTVLDRFADLWATAWGRVLLAKAGFVVLAAGAGAWNHFRVVPRLDGTNDAGRDQALAELGRTIRIEVVALLGAALLTAALIASAA